MRLDGVSIGLACLLAAAPHPAAAQPRNENDSFFQSEMEPVLRKNCIGCHNSRIRTSGLALDTEGGVRAGGKRGPVAGTGNPESSALYQAILHTGSLKMPPTGRLSDGEIAVFKRWIELKLPWAGNAVNGSGPGHWAFRAPVRPPEPTGDISWGNNAIDRFIRARLNQAALAPSPEADHATLLRRVSLDLTGLPPSPEELEAFRNDQRPGAYERVVDRLLASPHYGERWARHWLDAAHYADSNGYAIDSPREIWKYRDWVIQALNADLPFDRFVTEQMAGDLLPNPTTDQLVATGFYRNTMLNEEGGSDPEQYRVEAVVDRVATTGSALLGLTLGCARCHDHKYDPISQREFYQLYSFFNNIDEMTTGRDPARIREPVLEFGSPEEIARRRAFDSQMRALETELVIYEAALPPNTDVERDAGSLERRRNMVALRKQLPSAAYSTLILRELPRPREAYIHLGGEFTDKGDSVEPNTPAVLPPLGAKSTPNRLDLARWLVSRQHPLTARVAVNRIWQAYFGRGIVATQDDFGVKGAPPTHPELLDWLAVEFMEKNWSQKALHRLVVTSATYRQSSRQRAGVMEKDPGNELLARQNRLRLDAEIVRDVALRASGLYDGRVGGPSVFPPIPEGTLATTQIRREWPTSTGPDRYRRGLYTFFWRSAPHPTLVTFDAPDATASCTRRSRSNTPLQSLILLNDAAFLELAEGIGRTVRGAAPANPAARVIYAFQLTLGRPPSRTEQDRLLAFLATRRAAGDDDVQQWTAAARVLMNLDEFRTRE
jgi:hypothetical protein